MLDKLQLFPNQQIDGDPQECVGISVADVVGNMLGIPMDYDFSYSAGFNVMGETPSTAGEEPQAGVDGAIAFGALPASDETFTALSMGELYAANYNNYPLAQQQEAKKYVQNGVLYFYTFDEIYNYLQQQKTGVIIPIHFYENFFEGVNGVLPEPEGTFSNHCTAAYNFGEANGERAITQMKMWLGKEYGYCTMTESVFNKVFIGPGFAFDPSANRFISLLGILARRFPAFVSYIPQIIKKTS